MTTKLDIESRKAALIARRNAMAASCIELREELKAAEQGMAAFNGAILDCDYWLAAIQDDTKESP